MTADTARRLREPIVAIDGPAGTGKSTISAMLARRFGYVLIDTGAIYRAVALAAARAGVSADDGPALGALAGRLAIRFAWDGDTNRVFLGDEDVSTAIRQPEVSSAASRVARLPEVRDALLALQRMLGCDGGAVTEGRDIGTVVFPEAEVKFFLTADPEERARRRLEQLRAAGTAASLEDVLASQRARDDADTQRAVAPLRQADDAILVDSTALTIPEVVELMAARVESVRRAGARAALSEAATRAPS